MPNCQLPFFVYVGEAAKVHYGTSLSNVDWLHGGAESLLTLTNLFIVLGLREALRKAGDAKESSSDVVSGIKEEEPSIQVHGKGSMFQLFVHHPNYPDSSIICSSPLCQRLFLVFFCSCSVASILPIKLSLAIQLQAWLFSMKSTTMTATSFSGRKGSRNWLFDLSQYSLQWALPSLFLRVQR